MSFLKEQIEFDDNPGSYFGMLNESVAYINSNDSVITEAVKDQLSMKESTKKVNIREGLNRLDTATDNKYELYNTYLAGNYSQSERKKIAEAIYKNKSPKYIYSLLNEDKTIGDPIEEACTGKTITETFGSSLIIYSNDIGEQIISSTKGLFELYDELNNKGKYDYVVDLLYDVLYDKLDDEFFDYLTSNLGEDPIDIKDVSKFLRSSKVTRWLNMIEKNK